MLIALIMVGIVILVYFFFSFLYNFSLEISRKNPSTADMYRNQCYEKYIFSSKIDPEHPAVYTFTYKDRRCDEDKFISLRSEYWFYIGRIDIFDLEEEKEFLKQADEKEYPHGEVCKKLELAAIDIAIKKLDAFLNDERYDFTYKYVHIYPNDKEFIFRKLMDREYNLLADLHPNALSQSLINKKTNSSPVQPAENFTYGNKLYDMYKYIDVLSECLLYDIGKDHVRYFYTQSSYIDSLIFSVHEELGFNFASLAALSKEWGKANHKTSQEGK